MNVVIEPSVLSGTITAPPEEHFLQRALFCASFSEGSTTLRNVSVLSGNIKETISCLEALGAKIIHTGGELIIKPIAGLKNEKYIFYSGNNENLLKYIVPIVACLGIEAIIYYDVTVISENADFASVFYNDMGVSFSAANGAITVSGTLNKDRVFICRRLCSLIEGFIYAAVLTRKKISITWESAPFFAIDIECLKIFAADMKLTSSSFRTKGAPIISPGSIECEGSWAHAAPIIFAATRGNMLQVRGLPYYGHQYDLRYKNLLARVDAETTWDLGVLTVYPSYTKPFALDVCEYADLAPSLLLLMCMTEGTSCLYNINKLPKKELKQLQCICTNLAILGAQIILTDIDITIHGTRFLDGGRISTYGDGIVEMVSACACAVSKNSITLEGIGEAERHCASFYNTLEGIGASFHTVQSS